MGRGGGLNAGWVWAGGTRLPELIYSLLYLTEDFVHNL